jgi:hypothetical protein
MISYWFFAHDRELGAGAAIAEIGDEMTKAASQTPTQPMAAADPYALTARIALWLSGLVASVTMAAALYMHVPSMRAARATTSPALHDTAQERWSTATSEPEGEPVRVANPVRIANPFDASEVFEFPEGTSDAEARAAVAEALMKRAQERYAQLDSGVGKGGAAGS